MKIFEAIDGLVFGKINLFKLLITLIKLEARLACRSVLPLLVNVSCLIVVASAFWLLTMVFLGYCLVMVLHQVIWALLIIWFLNFCILILLAKSLQANLQNISFQKTRAYFSEDRHHDNVEETLACQYSGVGPEDTLPKTGGEG